MEGSPVTILEVTIFDTIRQIVNSEFEHVSLFAKFRDFYQGFVEIRGELGGGEVIELDREEDRAYIFVNRFDGLKWSLPHQ